MPPGSSGTAPVAPAARAPRRPLIPAAPARFARPSSSKAAAPRRRDDTGTPRGVRWSGGIGAQMHPFAGAAVRAGALPPVVPAMPAAAEKEDSAARLCRHRHTDGGSSGYRRRSGAGRIPGGDHVAGRSPADDFSSRVKKVLSHRFTRLGSSALVTTYDADQSAYRMPALRFPVRRTLWQSRTARWHCGRSAPKLPWFGGDAREADAKAQSTCVAARVSDLGRDRTHRRRAPLCTGCRGPTRPKYTMRTWSS